MFYIVQIEIHANLYKSAVFQNSLFCYEIFYNCLGFYDNCDEF